MDKRSAKAKDRAAVLRQLEASGQSLAEFCRDQGLAYGTVAAWRARAQRQRTVEWVEVEAVEGEMSGLPPTPAVGQSALAAELLLPGGAVLRIYRGTESC